MLNDEKFCKGIIELLSYLTMSGVNRVAIEHDIIKKAGNPLVRISCKVCGESFVLRGSVERDGTISTGAKMCFCGNEDLEQTLL